MADAAQTAEGLIDLVSPDGEVFGVPANAPVMQRLLASGWSPETPEAGQLRRDKKLYGGQELRANIEQALSDVTLGLSDQALTGFGVSTPEELAGRRRANPTGLGSVLGLGATFLLPGIGEANAARAASELTLGGALSGAAKGVTLPARLADAAGIAAGKSAASIVDAIAPAAIGSPTAAKAFARTAELATQGVVDGALFGAGKLVSEDALGDTELTAERLISEIGMSALMSGAMGGTLGGAIGIASPAARGARKFVESNVGKIPGIDREAAAYWLKDAANEATVASLGGISKMWRDLRKAGLQDIGPERLRQIHAPDGKPIISAGMKQADAVERLVATTDKLGEEIGDTITTIDARSPSVGLSRNDLTERIAERVLLPLENRIEAGPAEAAVVSMLQRMNKDTLGDIVTHADVQAYRNGLSQAYTGNVELPVKKALKHFERELNTVLEESLESKMSPLEWAEFKVKKDDYHALRVITDAAKLRDDVLRGNRFFSLSDRIAGGASGLASALDSGGNALEKAAQGGLTSLATAAIARQYRLRVPSTLAVVLDKASKLMGIEELAAKAAAREATAADEAARSFLGKMDAGKVGKSEALIFSNDAPRAGLTSILGLDVGTEGPVARSTITRGKNGYPEPTAKAKRMVANQSRLLGLMADDAAIADKITASVHDQIGDVAPQISRGIVSRMMLGLSFLAAKAPKPQLSPLATLTPNAPSEWEPSGADTIKYLRYADAVQNPQSVIADISAGRINKEGLETLRVLYPSFYATFTAAMTARIAESKKPLDYKSQMLLSAIMGIPGAAPQLNSKMLAAMQVPKKQESAQSAQPMGRTVKTRTIDAMDKSQKQLQPQSDRIAQNLE